MKIGILSDIHGNEEAFKNVLSQVRKEEIEKLIILGDIVGYYYGAEEIFEELNNWDTIIIKGNHEDMFLTYLVSDKSKKSEFHKKYGSSFQLLKENKDIISFIEQLPDKQSLKIANYSMLLSHSTPWDASYYLYPDKVDQMVDKIRLYEEDIILTGHTHYPMVFNLEEKMVINPGSVGQNRASGGVANWGVLTINSESKVFESKSTNYNIEPILRKIRDVDPKNSYLVEVLKR